MQKLKGKVWRAGNDIDTDLIIPARYLNTHDPEALAAHCFEDMDPGLIKKMEPGDILVAGKNFGCGSSREHAPIAMKHAGFSCVIAENYARIFYRNAINIGLPIIVAPEAARLIQEGEEVEVDPADGAIKNLSTGQVYRGEPFPSFMLDILAAGGLIPYVREKVRARG